ncbi:MAG: hypothetical protein QM744_12695 [Mesorhizobium sp.]
MTKAGFLAGLSDSLDLSRAWTIEVVGEDRRRDTFEDKFGVPPTMGFRHVPESFGRMLAKIGYCQALTALDVHDFRPICLPYIRGDARNLSYIVGSDGRGMSEPEPFDYRLNNCLAGDAERILLIVEVRLLALLPVPTYHVVVGDVVGRQNVQRVSKKIGDDAWTHISAFPQQINAPWAPSIWPLPA